MFKVVVFISLLALAVAFPQQYAPKPAQNYAAPQQQQYAAPQYKQPAQGYKTESNYPDVPPKYEFNYAVKDDASYNSFGHQESRDNDKTSGSYTVALPDGRTQITTYNVQDNYSGFNANVEYIGEAKHPQGYNNAAPAEGYKQPSKYAPAPY